MATTAWLKLVLMLVCCGVQWKPVDSQCSGTALSIIANHTYQTITSPNYPSNYPTNQNCVWVLQAENTTDAIRLEILDTAIEYHADCAYDKVEIFDGPGNNATYSTLIKFCGTSKPTVVSTGSYMTVTFTSDYSLGSRGFQGKYVSGKRDSLLDDEEEADTISFWILAAAVAGGALLFFGIGVIIYACYRSKKAKRSRQVIAWGPHNMLPAYSTGYHRPPEPIAYDNYFSGGGAPFSPPPGYCEEDPNPLPLPYISAMRHIQNDRLQTSDNRPQDTSSPIRDTNSRMQGANSRMQGANNGLSDTTTRAAVGHDTNANTHFVVPGNVRGLTSLNQQPPAGMPDQSRNSDALATPGTTNALQTGTPRRQAIGNDTGEIPGQPVDINNDTRVNPIGMSNGTSAGNHGSEQSAVNMPGLVPEENTQPRGNIQASGIGGVTGNAQANTRQAPQTGNLPPGSTTGGQNRNINKPSTGNQSAGKGNVQTGKTPVTGNTQDGNKSSVGNTRSGNKDGAGNIQPGNQQSANNTHAGIAKTSFVGTSTNAAGNGNQRSNNQSGSGVAVTHSVPSNAGTSGAPVIQGPASNPPLDRQISDVSDVTLSA